MPCCTFSRRMRGAAACSKLAYPCLHYGELGSSLRIRRLGSMSCFLASNCANAAQFISCTEPTDPSKCLWSLSCSFAVSLAYGTGWSQQSYGPGSFASAPQSLLLAIACIASECERRKLQPLSKMAHANGLSF